MNPLVSIIVPCYNVSNYIDRLMNSLTKQTIGIENIEIILFNDASTDDTYARLLEWEQHFPESIIVIHSEENVRQGAGRNIGVTYASGKYLTFVDADDWVELTMCKTMCELAETYQTDMVIGLLDRVTADGKTIPLHTFQEDFINITSLEQQLDFITRFRRYTFCTGILYNREWYLDNHLCFPEKLLYEDNVMFWFYAVAQRVYVINQVFYHYYTNSNSTTSSNRNPLDRIMVQSWLYQRLCDQQFDAIRDLIDYNLYDKAFFETVLYSVISSHSYDLLVYLKDVILQLVPSILTNSYYVRDKLLPNITGELLLHPVLEEEFTEDAFELFYKRTIYSYKHSGVLTYLELLTRIRRGIELASINSSAENFNPFFTELLKLVQQYQTESFAHLRIAHAFVDTVQSLATNQSYFQVPSQLLRLIDKFIIDITKEDSYE